jgi:hypothetical protein|tara:strand:+ start:1366 stop:1746 length:381 start_codon:yes stop_codon:yes gene_type:complete
MPQFDLFTFSSQIFWALFFFTLLYLSFAYYLIPSISATLKVRSRRLKFQDGSSQTSSAISASEDTSLDLYIITKLDLGAIFYNVDDYKLFISKSINSLKGSLTRFKLSNDLKDSKSFIFLEACLFH